ncbi:hypothetical protein HYH02_001032 [Chlamydomonas schloesseri]|uniref:Uncharacterized protein n=1 Tax=Chlamydomonas schloesseri TaxID=2026947 RepID=A0A835WTL7_9CHLO|nr:hypothetical protein HYH02_001032 [Chlamydomonas schloesseri]|eukprot:KAG2453988.1 hypothetical protein HYH02_001032 [Chlamydomonas schloesseri]
MQRALAERRVPLYRLGRSIAVVPRAQQQQQQPLPASARPPAQLPAGTGVPQPAGPPAPPPPPPLERAGDLPDKLLRDYLSGWSSQYTEYDYYVPPEAVYGKLPEEIKGTLYFIGPGLTQVYGTSVRHPADADGMVCSLAFADGGQIFFRNRYVRTPAFNTEQTLGRRTTRGLHDRGAATTHGSASSRQQQQPPAPPRSLQQQQQQPLQGGASGPLAGPGPGPLAGLPLPGPLQNLQRLPSPAALASWVLTGNSNGNIFPGSGSTPSSSSSSSSNPAAGASTNGSSTNGSSTSGTTSSNGSSSSGGGLQGIRARLQQEEEALWGAGADYGVTPSRTQSLAAAATRGERVTPALPSRLDPMSLLGLPPLPPLSALFNPLDTSFRAPVNANIVYWGGRLLAFTEGASLPYELNKLSLETVGPHDFGGAMADMGRLVAGYKVAPAPPHTPGAAVAAAAGGSGGAGAPAPALSRPAQRLVVLGAAQSGPDVLLRWLELGEDGTPAGPGAAAATTFRLPAASAHGVLDFWVTDKYYVVAQAPVDFNPQTFVTQATLGSASFAECFDWDPSRPTKLHFVARPGGTPPPAAPAAAAPTASPASGPGGRASSAGRGGGSSGRPGAGGGGGGGGAGSKTRPVIGSSAPVVWPPKGPDSFSVDVPALLPTSCVGCYSLGAGGSVLVLDALCQQGLTGSNGGTLDTLVAEFHRVQPKPELTRIVVDLATRTATARVLSQRTAAGVTTAAAYTGNPAAAAAVGTPTAAAAAAGPLAPVGSGAAFVGGYHHIFASAAATDAAAGWAPAQVLVKLKLSPDTGLPPPAAAAAAAAGQVPFSPDSATPLQRRRGGGAEVWSPGDRAFLSPPVFIPKRTAGSVATAFSGYTPPGVAAAAAAASPSFRLPGTLPPMETDVEAAAAAAAAEAAARRWQEEQDGWVVVLLNDAQAMRAELCVLDARDLTAGPVAVLELPHHVPHPRALHFTRAYAGPGLAAPPGWRPRTAAGATPAPSAQEEGKKA